MSEAFPTLISSDRRWLAYEVFSTPIDGEDTELFLPNGTPTLARPQRLYVIPAQGGTPQAVCREEVHCWRPSWSPNSRWLAYFSDVDGFPQLWVYDPRQRLSRRVSAVPIKAMVRAVDKPAWSPDSHEIFVPINLASSLKVDEEASTATSGRKGAPTVLVYRSGKESSLAGTNSQDPMEDRALRQSNATLAAVDVASGKIRVVVPAAAEPRPHCLMLSPDGQWISYVSPFKSRNAQSQPYHDLAVVKASGGKIIAIDVDIDTKARYYFGAAPYLWTVDSKRLLYTKGRRLWIVDVGSAGLQKSRLLSKNLGELNDEPFALTSDGKALLVGLKAEGENGFYDAPTLALVPLDGSEPKLLHAEGNPVTLDASILWQPEANLIYLIKTDRNTAERSIVQLDSDSASATTLWRGQGQVTVVGSGSDGSLMILFENLTTPPDLFRFTLRSGRMERLTQVEPRLVDVVMGPVARFETTVPVFDGSQRTVHSSIFLPPGAQKGDCLPTIVTFYPDWRASDQVQYYGGGDLTSIPIQIFVTRGYAVLAVDSPMSPPGAKGNPIQELGETILPQIYHSADLGYTDINRVAIMGTSYGGYGTAAMLTQTNLFRAGIAMGGDYDLGGDYGHMDPDGVIDFALYEGGQTRMGTHPWADLKRYVTNSPFYQADKINTPLLLIHGEDDPTCPVEESRKMFAALKRLGKTAQLATYAKGGHGPGLFPLVNSVDVAQRMLDFLDRYVKPVKRDPPSTSSR